VVDTDASGEAKPTIHDSAGAVRVGETVAGLLDLWEGRAPRLPRPRV